MVCILATSHQLGKLLTFGCQNGTNLSNKPWHDHIILVSTSDILQEEYPMRSNENVVETTAIVPPDGGWGWIIVVSSFFCNFMIDGVLYTFGIFLNHISETFEVHPTKVALGNSIMVGCYAMSGTLRILQRSNN
jgi:hypothetical protein